MYFGAEDPTDYVVKVATLGSLITLTNRSYITIDNISLIGGDDGIYSNTTSSYITIQNCDISFMGAWGIKFGGKIGQTTGGSNNTINNCTITDCNNVGIDANWWREFTDWTITNNTVTNSGTIPGMGQNSYYSYVGIRSWGDRGLIQYNRVINTGYHGIAYNGDDTHVLNNFVDTFVNVKGDGGGIYTVIQGDDPRTGQEIRNNIVLNAIGSPEGQSWDGLGAEGIYLDDVAQDVIIDGNTVAYCKGAGIFLHNAHEVDITDNLCFANGVGNIPDGSNMFFAHEAGEWNDDNIRNIVVTGNKLISTATEYSQTY